MIKNEEKEMNIVIVNGQNHKGSTYHIGRMLAERVKIDRQVDKVARQIRSHYGNAKPGLKTKAWFYAMRMVQSKFGWCAPDVKYWNEMGWTKKVRPWKGI